MTIFYPDLSHYDLSRGVTVQPNTVAVIAKATHGTAFLDSGYATLKQQAENVGAIFGGYHWLNHDNTTAQAAYCFNRIGRVPVMVDAEDTSGNTGYDDFLTVDDIIGFVTALRQLGGICNLAYLPQWYWRQHMGSPDLTPLTTLGVGLVASNYTTYSDSGPGWQPYGGVTPTCWQYTDKLNYGGAYCDFNAYRGTVDQFRALLTGEHAAPAVTPAPAHSAPAFPMHYPPNFFGDIKGPWYSHGGAVSWEKPTIVKIQNRLNALGCHCGAADGVFGPLTIAATRAFQHRHGLQVDGEIGPATWRALFS